MTEMMMVNAAFAGLNAVLALLLGVVYLRNHLQVRSQFTLGLVLFATFLLLHNVVVLIHLVTMMGTFALLGEGLLLAENILQAIALGWLVVATFR